MQKKYAIIGLIIAVAGLFRASLISLNRDFWHDEAFQYLYSMKSIGFITSATDTHPPLFSLFTKALIWSGIDNITALRAVMAVISIIAVWQLYCLAKEYYGQKTALYSSILFAVVPTIVYYSTEFRMYALGLLIVIIQMRMFRRIATGLDTQWFGYYILATLAMLWTHYMTALILVPQAIYIFYARKKFLFKYLAWMMAVCLPTIIYIIITLPKIKSFWFKDITWWSLLSTFTHMVSMPLVRVTGISLLVFALAVFAVAQHRTRKEMLISSYVWLPPVIMFLIAQVGFRFYHHRYFMFGSVGLFILAGRGLQILENHKQHLVSVVGGTFLLIMIVTGNSLAYNYELRDSSSFLADRINNSECKILHTSPFSQTPYKVYLPECEHYLLTALTRQELFTAGGAVIEDWEIIRMMIPVDYIVTEQNFSQEVIWSEGGLQIYDVAEKK